MFIYESEYKKLINEKEELAEKNENLTQQIKEIEKPNDKIKRLEKEIEVNVKDFRRIIGEKADLERENEDLKSKICALEDAMDTLKKKSCELIEIMQYREQTEYSLRTQLKACEFALAALNVDNGVLLEEFKDNNQKIKQLEPGYKKELAEHEKRLEEERVAQTCEKYNVYAGSM